MYESSFPTDPHAHALALAERRVGIAAGLIAFFSGTGIVALPLMMLGPVAGGAFLALGYACIAGNIITLPVFIGLVLHADTLRRRVRGTEFGGSGI